MFAVKADTFKLPSWTTSSYESGFVITSLHAVETPPSLIVPTTPLQRENMRVRIRGVR